jgi:nitronate monooxygenase
MSDGVGIRAAEVLGCDLAYMGTRFIATEESLANEAYKRTVVKSTMDDVVLTDRLSGLSASVLSTSPGFAKLMDGLEPVQPTATPEVSAVERNMFSAGHSVSGVHDVPSIRQLVEDLVAEFNASKMAPPLH